jgi:hypothetical protein
MHGFKGILNLIYKDLVHILYLIFVCALAGVETLCHYEVNER